MNEKLKSQIIEDLANGHAILSRVGANWAWIKRPEPILYVLARRAIASGNDWTPSPELRIDLEPLCRKDGSQFNPQDFFSKRFTEIEKSGTVRTSRSGPIERWKPYLERERTSRNRSDGVYTYRLSKELYELIVELQLVEQQEISADIAEKEIQQRHDLSPREKLQLVRARRGQGVYRRSLEAIESRCRITLVEDARHLRASHIKPWCRSNDEEKLDGNNGLLLSPHVDHLFDKGYISFSDEGTVLIADELDRAVLSGWGLVLPKSAGRFSPQQSRYLAYHRKHVFEKGRA